MVVNVLLIGDGAREHIIAERLAEDSNVYAIMSRKNPGISGIAKSVRICNLKDKEAVRSAIESFSISFDVGFVSPDAVLAAGITDLLLEMNISAASPTQSAARIEWDKSFARNLMYENKIDGLPEFNVITDKKEITDYLNILNNNAVIKPIGLTGGKGVKIIGEHLNPNEAIGYATELLERDGSVLIEEKLDGEEFTLQAFSDGKHISLMPPVQDHKRLYDGDKGPNTGGMGSYSTGKILPFLEQSDLATATKILSDAIWSMSKEDVPFKGILYGQFMATKKGVKVIEFNSRFGDPEVMNVLSLLDGSLSDIFMSIADDSLVNATFMDKSTLVKYFVPKGYPKNPDKDSPVSIDLKGINQTGARLYFASVYEQSGKIYTTSSRTAALVSVADNLDDAYNTIEDAQKYISGNLFSRTDIGTKQLIQKRIDHMKLLRGGMQNE